MSAVNTPAGLMYDRPDSALQGISGKSNAIKITSADLNATLGLIDERKSSGHNLPNSSFGNINASEEYTKANKRGPLSLVSLVQLTPNVQAKQTLKKQAKKMARKLKQEEERKLQEVFSLFMNNQTFLLKYILRVSICDSCLCNT